MKKAHDHIGEALGRVSRRPNSAVHKAKANGGAHRNLDDHTPTQQSAWKIGSFSAKELQKMTFPPLEAIGVIQTNLNQTLSSFESPEQAEGVAHELLRVAAQWRLSSGRTSEHTFGETNRHVVEVPDTFAIARWRRDADVATICRCILGTLKYEPHGTDTTALRRALETVIEREGAPSTVIAAPVSDEEEAFWREMARMPDLQKLIERAGRRHAASIGEAYDPNPATRPKHQAGHKHITPEEWAKWDAANAEFQANRQTR